ncbi:MAG TPA: hypothetical protein VFW48_08320 [Solirubrobacterales bacterium]|nr:hypothetical protein [Solirubrobacterales bacterium]
MPRATFPITVALAGVALVSSGCESTQDKSAKIAAELGPVKQEKGVTITKESKDVKVLDTTLLTDEVGTAVVVELRNDSSKDLIDVPIAIDVLDAKGKSVYTNTTPGLEPALAAVPFIAAGGEVAWVNDQVLVAGKPAKVEVKVGASEETFSGQQPQVSVSAPKLKGDPFTGVAASGEIVNESGEDIQRLLLYGVARQGGRIVAAGRGAIEHFKAGAKPAPYDIFFIGDPRDAEVTVTEFPSLPGQEQP